MAEAPRVPVAGLMTEVASMVRKTLDSIQSATGDTRLHEKRALQNRVHQMTTTGGGFMGLGNNTESVPAAVALAVYDEARELAEAIVSPARMLVEAEKHSSLYAKISEEVAVFFKYKWADGQYKPLLEEYRRVERQLGLAPVGLFDWGKKEFNPAFPAAVKSAFTRLAEEGRVEDFTVATYNAIRLRDALKAMWKLGVTIPLDYALEGRIPGWSRVTNQDELDWIAETYRDVEMAVKHGGKGRLADAFAVVEDYHRKLQESVKIAANGVMSSDGFYTQYVIDNLKKMMDQPR